MKSERSGDNPATTHDTVDAIVDTAVRPEFPLRRTFIQQKGIEPPLPGPPLAGLVTAGDRVGLLLYFLALTKASREPWDVSLHSAVWARALGIPEPNTTVARTRVSKTWGRLVARKLVARSRHKRLARFTLLCEDGSGDPYERPSSQYVKVPHALWTAGPEPSNRWFEILSLPELAFLVIALSNLDAFALPAERGPDYYRVSADTLLRGQRGLRERGLLKVERSIVKAPLAPEGVTIENLYTLQQPFGPHGKKSKAASRPR